MEIVVGAPVTGENLHGREDELDELWSRIKINSILLSSPRRFGKTSLVKEMKRAPRDGFEVVYLDVESVNSVQEFVSRLAGALPKPAQQTLLRRFAKNLRDNVEEIEISHLRMKLREGTKEDCMRDGEDLFYMLQDAGKPHIIVVDELPSFLLNLESVGAQSQSIGMVLRWLRQMRQSYDARFVVCGSIGIDNILRRHGLSNTVNDLERISVSPFGHDTASRMIKHLLDKARIKYEPDHVQKILGKIGVPSPPYFVQIMLREIVKTADAKEGLSENVIDRSYQRVLNDTGKEYFEWYYDRLKTEFPPDQLHAVVSLLDHLAEREPSSKSDLSHVFFNALKREDGELFRNAVRVLESGFYITKDSRYSFRVKVLRDWWAERRAD